MMSEIMTDKKIKPYAIVPSSLYVRREADAQLRQIIADMGRPGYVLVSRQMGKTNLLLNAKREVDSLGDVFVYLDVSNAFSDLRSFFRNITDTILDGAELSLAEVSTLINEARLSADIMQPHKEHERELRAILRAIPGKLVICLDEIDALTKVDYSDNVFSLIRSIYFSGRTNFAEFYRLTYVLSGVADPSELIKNKAISPFNIGEKIYLNDFSLDETFLFLTQCALTFSSEAVSRIFYWASGNPRMTWDICSALESQVISGVHIDEREVDFVVEGLYLKDFDLPPIDHIRTRVELDKEIRNAVMSIHYDKTLSLSDKVKDRLYLAGISTPKAIDGSIKFRNKIMALSLSEKWISDVEVRSTTLENRAADKLRLKQYQDAIDLYTEFLAGNENQEKRNAVLLNVGFCQAMQEKFDEAIEVLSPVNLTLDKHPYFYSFRSYWLGLCYLCKGDYAVAKNEFSKICDQGLTEHSSGFYFQSQVNLAISQFKEFGDFSKDDFESGAVEELLLQVIASEDQMTKYNQVAAVRKVLYSAHYHLALYYMRTENSAGAMESLDKALFYAGEGEKLNLMIYRASFQSDSSIEASIYSNCASELIKTNVYLSRAKQINPAAVTLDECANLIYNLARLDAKQSVIDLINYLDVTRDKQIISSWSLCLQATLIALGDGDVTTFARLTHYRLMTVTEETPVDEVFQTLCFAILLPGGEERAEFADKFVTLFLNMNDYALRDADIRVIWEVVLYKLAVGNFNEALRIYECAADCFERSVSQDKFSENIVQSGRAIFEYMKIKIYGMAEGQKLCNYSALMDIHLSPEKFELPFFNSDFLARFLTEDFSSPREAGRVKGGQKIGRNEIVEIVFNDGKKVKGKYKKLLQIIESGEASLVTDA
ncbi:hypothetical protein BLL37_17685 [Pseudomonas azotoformans]|uniref:Tetratricopeptide repeat protein n=1 Tax=Pseudomonas azotoformans TaxID=47878 RepID=A0A1V2JG61_PSEAZ|nr:AAA-like domain-containing protein [Pseudomonas azotoformans]OIN43461.1 hypothetical protein BFL39_00255 [Pseudomonas azotoformans]ONH43631.1 hypothetical protein BLL37_17685 [Pseudomonas azotoformans]SDO47158.1 AAA-like domain-containing protein [Pseudomonas azotoformans]